MSGRGGSHTFFSGGTERKNYKIYMDKYMEVKNCTSSKMFLAGCKNKRKRTKNKILEKIVQKIRNFTN